AFVETFPDAVAAGDQARAARPRLERFRALGYRSDGTELAGFDPLRVFAPRAHHPPQHGRAHAAADSPRARLDARLPRQRGARARAAHVVGVRPGADLLPDDADLVARAIGRRRRARRIPGGAVPGFARAAGARHRHRVRVRDLRVAAPARGPLV